MAIADYSLDGMNEISVYSVMPGIEVINLNIKGSCYRIDQYNNRNALVINHCLEGRSECRMLDGCFQYIGEGDLFMTPSYNLGDSIELPLGYYRGLMIIIDFDAANQGILELLPSRSVNINELSKRFFKTAGCECFMIQAKDEIWHIFALAYAAPEQTRHIYYRLKVQELLLYLHYFDAAKEMQKGAYAWQQVDMIKQIRKQVTENPGHRFTIEELAAEHCISPTSLKTNFKGVYGISIAAYMKEYRIRCAADLLRHTQKSIAQIASEMGYESQSKFGAAFKKIMKMTPIEYRKKHT